MSHLCSLTYSNLFASCVNHAKHYKWCPDKTSGDKTSGDKTSGDKTSVDKTSVGTKRPWGQNIRSNKTSVGQNVRGDKRSVRQNVRQTKRPSDKTSVRQNVREDKMSVGTKRPWTKRPPGSYLSGPLLGNFFTDKNLLSVKEEKSANTHTLSLWEGGGETCTVYNKEVLYIFYQNSLHPYHVTLLKCNILHFFRLG
jgi:hypothetical protein